MLKAQVTYIPLPEEYGIINSNGLVPKYSIPFYENNGYIYCYTRTKNSVSGYYVGKIAKVDIATNTVTIMAGEIPSDETPCFVRTYNGMIYFKTSSYNLLYQINPTTNSLINFSQTYLGNNQVLTDYSFINNKLYFTPNGVAQVYDFNSNTMTELKYYDTPSHFYYLRISGIYVNSSSIYLTGFYEDGTNNPRKIFKINDSGNIVSLLSTTNNSLEYYWFRDLSRFIKINNSLLTLNRVNQNGVIYNKIESINLSNNTVNTNYFTYQSDNSGATPLAPYIFNNLVYITDGDRIYTSDGSSAPVLINLPPFLTNQSTALSPEYPLINIPNPVFQASNKVLGQRNYTISSGNNPSTSELWISDGSLSGTHIVKNIKSYYQAPNLISVFANNSIYFHEKNHYEGSYLYKTDGTIQGTYPVYKFENNVSIDYNFYGSGKYLYYSTYQDNAKSGLYKIDLSQLTQLSIKETEHKNSLTVYPNPTNSFFTIQKKESSAESFDYKIIDITGKLIKKGQSIFNEKINIENLKTGNYIIQIESKTGKTVNIKLIKN